MKKQHVYLRGAGDFIVVGRDPKTGRVAVSTYIGIELAQEHNLIKLNALYGRHSTVQVDSTLKVIRKTIERKRKGVEPVEYLGTL